jgi:hypothetical protein
VPTSVLLAVLVAAGLLALAPALTRRYDATERVEAERTSSTARVLSRRRRRRTVPGRRPLNPPSFLIRSVPSPRRAPVPPVRRRAPARRRVSALHRRRRVFLALVLLNLIELAGVFLVGPGFWIGFSVSFTVLLADLVYLRQRALASARLRRFRLQRARWIAQEQAAVRREHDRRAASRAAAVRQALAERDDARRAALRQSSSYTERYGSS